MSGEVTKFVVEKSIECHRAEGRLLRDMAERWLEEFFGERCPDFSPTCEVCKRWAALDALFEEA